MIGNGAIVFRLNNGQNFVEHDTVEVARLEAHRLASSIGGSFVVYVPVVIVERAPQTKETPVTLAGEMPF